MRAPAGAKDLLGNGFLSPFHGSLSAFFFQGFATLAVTSSRDR
jgi:hypothetical protein